MKNKAIGIFDSGIGGLTVANAIYKRLPKERLLYFGDTAHLPYGDQSPEAINSYVKGISEFLLEKECKALVIACNTASSVGYENLRKRLPENFPVINVIDPVVHRVIDAGIRKVGVIGTKRTIESGVYQDKLIAAQSDLLVAPKVTRSLATIIEEGFFQDDPAITAILTYYLNDAEFKGIDGLILGCTHYPIVKDKIENYFGLDVHIFDSPGIVADYLEAELRNLNLLRDEKATSSNEFYVSDFTEIMNFTTSIFFDEAIQWQEENIWL